MYFWEGKAKVMTRLSIIIPVYNVASYIKRCLESVLSQDHVLLDIELIIVDDCGQDQSMDVVDQILAAYNGSILCKVLRHEKNLGLSAARNTGLKAANGDYVLFIDSDDYLLPNSISYFLEAGKQYPNVDVLMGNVVDPHSAEGWIPSIKQPLLLNDPVEIMRRLFNRQIYTCAWNKLIRREVLLEHHIEFFEGILFEDNLWSYQLLSCITTIVLLPRATYFYEFNPCSITNAILNPERVHHMMYSYKVTCHLLLANPPAAKRYKGKLTVDFLLFIYFVLIKAFNYLSKVSESESVAYYKAARAELMSKTLLMRRLILALFFLSLYWPLNQWIHISFFRRHYMNIERMVSRVGNLTNFLRGKMK